MPEAVRRLTTWEQKSGMLVTLMMKKLDEISGQIEKNTNRLEGELSGLRTQVNIIEEDVAPIKHIRALLDRILP